MINIKVKTLGAVLAALATLNAHAAPEAGPDIGDGTLFPQLFGDTLQKDYGIRVAGLIDAGYLRNNTSTASERKSGLTNLPEVGFADENFELATTNLFIDKPLIGTMIPRITPLPGPKPTELSFGFTVELLYGRNAQFAGTTGWDAHWGVNSPGASNPEKAARDREKFFATPNLAATAYVPYGPGINLMAGIFGPAMGYEIPPNVRNARNAFGSKTYAFITEPSTVAGVLAGSRVYSSDTQLLGVELGVVQGYGNLRDNNIEKSVIGALRWRTADMQTWIDYEFMLGDEQNDSLHDVQAPVSPVIAESGQLKTQNSLNGWHRFNSNWSMGAEVVYGHQAGDGKPTTIDVASGPGFDGAHWWGANAVVTYQQRSDLSYSFRAEHFADPEGFVLFPVSTARGAFNSLTTGLRYDLNKYVSLRPEVRYDWFEGNADDHPFGSGRDNTQLSGLLEALVYF